MVNFWTVYDAPQWAASKAQRNRPDFMTQFRLTPNTSQAIPDNYVGRTVCGNPTPLSQAVTHVPRQASAGGVAYVLQTRPAPKMHH